MFGGIPFAQFHSFGGMPGGMGGPSEEEENESVDTTKLYDVLGVEKTASSAEIRRAYMFMAKKNHPDKGGDPELFKEISKAYEILGDSDKRKLYDTHGEKGVENGGAPQGADDLFSMFFGGGRRPAGPRKGEDTVHPLRVSLEDLYSGKTVRLRVNKSKYTKDPHGNVMDRSGQRYSKQTEGKILEVHIERGMKHGQKITFRGEGDEIPGMQPGDFVFVVQQKQHPDFQRRGADLILTKKISLLEALTGVALQINHLDGHKVNIRSSRGVVIQPDSIKQVVDEGMPVYGNTHVKGCLFIRFEVEFPESLELTSGMQGALKGILPPALNPPIDSSEDEFVEEKVLEEVDSEARRMREQIGKDAYESDDEDAMPGAQRVQCAHQ